MVEVLWAFHVSMSTGVVLVQVTFRQSCWWDFILGIASDTWYDFCIISISLWELLNLRLGFWCKTQGLTSIRQTLYFKHTNQSVLSRVDQNQHKDQWPASTVNCGLDVPPYVHPHSQHRMAKGRLPVSWREGTLSRGTVMHSGPANQHSCQAQGLYTALLYDQNRQHSFLVPLSWALDSW